MTNACSDKAHVMCHFQGVDSISRDACVRETSPRLEHSNDTQLTRYLAAVGGRRRPGKAGQDYAVFMGFVR